MNSWTSRDKASQRGNSQHELYEVKHNGIAIAVQQASQLPASVCKISASYASAIDIPVFLEMPWGTYYNGGLFVPKGKMSKRERKMHAKTQQRLLFDSTLGFPGEGPGDTRNRHQLDKQIRAVKRLREEDAKKKKRDRTKMRARKKSGKTFDPTKGFPGEGPKKCNAAGECKRVGDHWHPKRAKEGADKRLNEKKSQKKTPEWAKKKCRNRLVCDSCPTHVHSHEHALTWVKVAKGDDTLRLNVDLNDATSRGTTPTADSVDGNMFPESESLVMMEEKFGHIDWTPCASPVDLFTDLPPLEGEYNVTGRDLSDVDEWLDSSTEEESPSPDEKKEQVGSPDTEMVHLYCRGPVHFADFCPRWLRTKEEIACDTEQDVLKCRSFAAHLTYRGKILLTLISLIGMLYCVPDFGWAILSSVKWALREFGPETRTSSQIFVDNLKEEVKQFFIPLLDYLRNCGIVQVQYYATLVYEYFFLPPPPVPWDRIAVGFGLVVLYTTMLYLCQKYTRWLVYLAEGRFNSTVEVCINRPLFKFLDKNPTLFPRRGLSSDKIPASLESSVRYAVANSKLRHEDTRIDEDTIAYYLQRRLLAALRGERYHGGSQGLQDFQQ